MSSPHIAIIYEESLSDDLFRDFAEELSNEEVKVAVNTRPRSGPQACLEWFMIPLVAVYILKPYCTGFLGEMGKDHYIILKRNLSKTAGKVINNPRIEPVIYGTSGKVSRENPYSLAFSVYAEIDNNCRLKLLIPKPENEISHKEIIRVFLEFLSEYHAGRKKLDVIGLNTNIRPPGGEILVHVNPATKSIEWLDHRGGA